LAEILGRHAAGVFKTMSGLEPDRLEIVEAVESEGPRYPMGVRVAFQGRDRQSRPWSGFFICAFATLEAARDIAMAIAQKLGVAESVTGTVDSVDDVLGEFLNIIIGLTCSDWTDRGLETEFDPPDKLVERQMSGFAPGTKAFHLTMTIDGHAPVSFFLVFHSDAEGA
jgi:hypothetical protein